jgi:hypothetical protein
MPDHNLGFLPTDGSIIRPAEDVTVAERELSFRLNLDEFRNDNYLYKNAQHYYPFYGQPCP